MFNSYVTGLVVCVVLEVLVGIILPEGKIRKTCLMVVGLYLFYYLISPLCDIVAGV